MTRILSVEDVSPISIVRFLERKSKPLETSLKFALLALPSTAGLWTDTIRRSGGSCFATYFVIGPLGPNDEG